MVKQENNLQVKEKEEFPEKELNEVEARKLSVIEFKLMVIRMFKELMRTESARKGQRNYEYEPVGNVQCNI